MSFIALLYLDLALTLVAAQAGLRELNPAMAWMLANPFQLILVKVVAPPVLAWLAPGPLLTPSVVFAAGIILWNFQVLWSAL